MDRCGRCGRGVPEGILECPECGGTARPSGPRFHGGPLFHAGQRLGDRFVVEQILGSGSSGAVYGVHDELMGRGAALKVLWEEATDNDPAFERLRREILAAQSIQDPRVVAIYELLILEGRPALVMERVEGSTLRQCIQREGPMPPEEAARVLRDILGALVLLHAAGIVHRDVKSGNILLAPDGAVKLGDFGLVKGDDLGGVTLTATGTTLGTPGYMAPEVIRGEAATPRSDLYGAGVILFELLTGRLPFEGNSAVEVAGKHLTQQPPMSLVQEKKTPRWLVQVSARLLEKDPADRFASPKEALAALDRRRRSLRLNRRARLSALAAALLLGMASFAVWFVLRPGSLTATFHDKVLEARDASSHVLWSQTLPNTIQSAVAGRFGPKGSWAVACSTQWSADHADLRGVEPSQENAPTLWVYDRRGKILAKFVSPIAFKGVSPRFSLNLSSHRFAPGESERLVIYARHLTWHPTALLVYSFQSRQPWETGGRASDFSIRNSGSISGWVYKDLDGDGREDIVYAGVNMPLYWSDFVAAVKVPASGALGSELVSPDIESGFSETPLFYRLFSFDPFRRMKVRQDAFGMPLITLGTGSPWLLDPSGNLLRAGHITGPPGEIVSRLNAAFPRLCYLRDGRLFPELLDESAKLPSSGDETYDWIKTLFRASALQGMGRYEDVIRELNSPNRHASPMYARQLALDALFLAGRYVECIHLYDSFPEDVRMAKPELGNTALFAALFSDDSRAFQRVTQASGVTSYDWYPLMLKALQQCMRGDPTDAEKDLRSLGAEMDQEAEPRLLLVECLIREGRLKEARRSLAETQHWYEESRRDIDGTDLWLKWREGSRDPALLDRFSALLDEARREAVTIPRSRVFLPLSLHRAARMYQESGDLRGARILSQEAISLAPKSWKMGLSLR